MRHFVWRLVPAILATVLTLFPVVAVAIEDETPSKSELTADQQTALGRISANSLRGTSRSWPRISSKVGDTPLRGSHLAAEYIAAQFRRAGLFRARGRRWLLPDRQLAGRRA